ncbi:MAG: hypothetical protein AB7O91_04395 [Sphingomonas sp.]
MKSLARLALAAAFAATMPVAVPAQSGDRTIVTDRAALQRLRRNSGITLQWISFESPRRGHVRVTERNGLVHLNGRQVSADGRGRVELDGDVLRIGSDRFTLAGNITITNAPDQGRVCVREGEFEFRVTRNRRYWRLQQMEACGGLTDYVDIYF